MKKWICSVCSFLYDPVVGDPEHGIIPGTAFEDIPAEWVCPICGVGKDMFEQEQELTNIKKEIPHGIIPALNTVSYGLYIITSKDGDKINGQCANTVFQVTSVPPTIAIGINKHNYTHQLIETSGKVGISVLGKNGHALVFGFGYRSGRETNKFTDISYRPGASGVPFLNDAIAFLEGNVIQKMDCGSHTLFLLEVTAGDLVVDSEPMTYAYFRATK